MGRLGTEIVMNNYGEHINDAHDGETFEICAGIGHMWTDIHSLIWAKIEEGETGSGFGTPISVYHLPSLHKFQSLSVMRIINMLSIIVHYYFCAQSTHKPVIT